MMMVIIIIIIILLLLPGWQRRRRQGSNGMTGRVDESDDVLTATAVPGQRRRVTARRGKRTKDP